MAFHDTHPKLADWTPPWGDDPDSIDPDELAKLIFNLKTSESKRESTTAAELAEANEALEVYRAAEAEARKAQESDAEKVARETAERDKVMEATKRENDLLKVRLEKKLTEKQAKRLVGDNLEELLKDADEMLVDLGVVEAEPETDEERAEREAKEAEEAAEAEEEELVADPSRQPRVRRVANAEKEVEGADDIDAYFKNRDANGSY